MSVCIEHVTTVNFVTLKLKRRGIEAIELQYKSIEDT